MLQEGVNLDHAFTLERPKLLVVDDEPDTITLLKHLFQGVGYDVSGAFGGREAIEKIKTLNPNLVILDLMMPEMDGWQTYLRLREFYDSPVIAITALDQAESIVKTLEMGIDDYITKPFFQSEVIARVQAVLRRATQARKANRLGFSSIDLILDLETQEITYRGKRVQLTGKMFEVLLLLARSAPRVVTYDEIAMSTWGENSLAIHNRLKYLIYLLRQEFENIDPNSPIIKNVDRVGYKLLVEE